MSRVTHEVIIDADPYDFVDRDRVAKNNHRDFCAKKDIFRVVFEKLDRNPISSRRFTYIEFGSEENKCREHDSQMMNSVTSHAKMMLCKIVIDIYVSNTMCCHHNCSFHPEGVLREDEHD